jgi:tetratricopeptide (TPR) repeat protein
MSRDHDFVLQVDGGSGSYRLYVSCPAGDDSVDIEIDPAALGVDLDTMQAHVVASAQMSRAMVPELEQPLRRFGEALFGIVFQPSVGALFLSSRNEAERAGGRLRIVLRLHAPELAVLPWELLFSHRYGGYLCRRSPMVRYVDAPEPFRPLTSAPPLRILGMTALPGDLAALDADAEQRRLQRVLAPFEASGLVAVEWVPGQSYEAAQDALQRGCQVFHFIGHGGFDQDRGEGVIAFADERGRRQPVAASRLADLLSVADPMPRLVVLNSCQTAAASAADVFSSTAATLVRTVPAVVAMQFAVTDDAAAAFSRAFYQALVNDRGVDEAVRNGRIALTGWNPDTLEWITPVLYLRSRDTRLFDFTIAGTGSGRADDQSQQSRKAVLARYWAARSTGDWDPVIAELGVLHSQLPGDKEVGDAYRDARLAARYAQGLRAEEERDWSGAVAHYQAVFEARPGYRDTQARLEDCARRRDIAGLQEQLRAMFTAGEFHAVIGIADRLTELDGAHADPDGLTTQARQRLQPGPGEPQASPKAADDRAYVDGLSALFSGRFDEAVDHFTALRARFPDDPLVRERLRKAQSRRDRAAWYRQGVSAAELGDWDEAVAAFERIPADDDSHTDVPEKLSQARQQQRRSRLIEDLRRLHAAGQWQAVIAAGQELAKLDPATSDPDGLVTLARDALAEEALASRYATGLRQFDAQEWSAALTTFSGIEHDRPGYRDTPTLLSQAQRRQRVAELRNQLRGYSEAGDWAAVVATSDQLAELDSHGADPDGLATQARRTLIFAQIRDLLKGREHQLRIAQLDAERKAREQAQRKAAARLDPAEAARLRDVALEFLAKVDELSAGTGSVAAAIPAESRPVIPAGQEPAAKNPGLELRWFPATDQPDNLEQDRTFESSWRVQLVDSNKTTRILVIQLSHGAYELEIKLRRFNSSILLDGDTVVRQSDITYQTHFFAIPDGQARRKAEVWVTSNLAKHIDGLRLTIDGQLLYQE